MKKQSLLLGLSLLFCSIFSVAQEQNQTVLQIDPNQSEIEWLAKKVTGQHNGKIQMKAGSMIVENGELKGGAFTIQMNSISVDDIKSKGMNKKLVKHLKSKDFFETMTYPTASFEIISVQASKISQQYLVTGNMTILDKTHAISFPISWQQQGKLFLAQAKINVDRTKFGVIYRSGSFFDKLKNKAINDEFTLDVSIRTKEGI